MSESKHTPGPWVGDRYRARINEEVNQIPVCELLWPTELRSEKETLSNAYLIAAAPDMLEALECVKEGLLGWEDAVDHALLKAKGKKA